MLISLETPISSKNAKKNMAYSKNVIGETNKCSMLDTCCGFLRELYLQVFR